MSDIDGTAGNDTLNGTLGDDVINGFGGSDTINGEDGSDTLNGGDDGDYLNGGLGADTLNGDAGNDQLQGGAGDDVLNGGDGDDYLYDAQGTNTLNGGDGNDTIQAYSSNATVSGGAGSDTIYASYNATIDAGADNDSIHLNSSNLTITTGTGSDTLSFNHYSYTAVITDFTAGDGGDSFNLTQLLSNLPSYPGGNPFATGHMRVVQSGADTLVQVDYDGSGGGGGWSTTSTLQGVTATNLTAANFGGYGPDGSPVAGATIDGTAGGETLNGTLGDDVINGFEGNDTINGEDGADTLNGGDGTDYLNGGLGSDTLNGDAGNDQLQGGAGDDVLNGGDGDDNLYDYQGTNTFNGGGGNDTIQASSSNAIVVGGAGSDTIYATYNATIDAGADNDSIHVNGSNLTITTGTGSDTLWLNSFGNTSVVTDFTAGDGADSFNITQMLAGLSSYPGGNPFATGHMQLVQSGADTLVQVDYDGSGGGGWSTTLTLQGVTATNLTAANFGGYGPDGSPVAGATIDGTAGNDTLNGTLGDDVINGFAGYDQLIGHDGADILNGGADGDNLDGGLGADTLNGDAGNDQLNGGAGDDVLDGGDDNDSLNGGAGDDVLNGGDGNDNLYDTQGTDTLNGGGGNDTIQAYGSNATVIGGAGSDTIYASYYATVDAGADNDSINLNSSNLTITTGTGSDTIRANYYYSTSVITDFTAGHGGDIFHLTQLLSNLPSYPGGNPFATGHMRVVQNGADTLIQVDQDGSGAGGWTTTATLQGVTATDLTSFNFGGYNTDGSIQTTPSAIPDSASGDEDSTLSGQVAAIDPDSSTLTFALASGPTNGDVVFNSNGSWTYTPDADFNGTDSFTFTASDGTETSSPATVTLTVDPVNDAPAGADKTVSIDEDSTYTFALADFGITDVEGDTFDGVRITTLPANGSLQLSGSPLAADMVVTAAHIDAGYLTFVPSADSNGVGQASFTFQVRDSGGAQDESANTFTFDIDAINDAPVVAILGESLSAGEVRVNSTTLGHQLYPSIAGLSDGSYVVSWASDDGSDWGVYAQRYGADGNPLGGEFRVNTATDGAQSTPSITGLSGGGFVIAWTSFAQDGSLNGIYAQRYSTDGTAVDGEFRVNTTTAESQDQPSITALADGGFLVAWIADVGSGSGVFAQLYDADGGAVGGEFLVGWAQANTQEAPSITGLTDGGFVVTWTADDSFDFGNSNIQARRYDADGSPLGGGIVANTSAADDPKQPSIAALSDGGFVVSWQSWAQDGSGWGIYAQRFGVDGLPDGGEFLVNTTTDGSQHEPSVTALAAGAFVVTWTSFNQDGEASGIYGQRYGSDGLPEGGEFLVNATTAGDQSMPSVTALSSGDFVVSWASWSDNQDGDGFGIYSQRFANGFEVAEQTATDLKGTLSISDVDAGAGTITATLSVGFGILNVAAGTSGADLSGSGTGSVTITGTLAQINDLLTSNATSSVDYVANSDTPPPSATLTLSVDDGGNSGSGGALVDTATATIFIASVNDEPSGADATVSIAEDGAHIFAAGDFGFGDVDGDAFAGVVITTLPATGDLYFDGTAITVAGTFVSAADIAANLLTYQPDADGNGDDYATFTYQVRDDGGVDDGGQDTDQTPNTITIDVDSINDAPVVTIAPTGIQAVGGEFLVNTTTAGYQGVPSITTLSDGGFVVSWTSEGDAGPSDYGIYAQRYGADGNTVGAEFRVNTTTEDSQQSSAIAGLADGGLLVTWMAYAQDGSGYGIYAQRYAADGSTMGGEFMVSTTTAGDQFLPSIAALADGGFVVSWMSPVDGSPAIFTQRYGADGNAVGGESIVSTTPPGGHEPSIAALADGGFVVTWMAVVDDAWRVYGQRFGADGLAVGGEFGVAGTGYQTYPAITGLADGGFLLSWDSYDSGNGAQEIHAQLFGADGAPIGGQFQVNTTTANPQLNSSIVALADGGFVVTWESSQDGSEYNIYAQRYSADGTAIGGEFLVNTTTAGDQLRPSLTALDNGGLVAIWTSLDQDGSDWGVYAQRFETGLLATEQTASDLRGVMSIADVDAGSATVTATLSVDYGILNVTAGTSGAEVSGSGTAIVTISGTLAQINDLLTGNATSTVDYVANSDTPPASAELTLSVDDGGNTGSGGALVGSTTATIFIASVNDAPSGTSTTVSTTEDEDYVFTVANLNYQDAENDALSGIRIDTLPSQGQLLLDGVPVISGQFVTVDDINDGKLVFRPDPNEFGPAYATIDLTVRDSGGAFASVASTITIDVTSDAPATANDDAFTTDEATAIVGGDLFADNGSGADSDPNGDSISITEVNGSAAAVGSQVTLRSGALLTVNADGTFDYDPNGAFDTRPAPDSGAANTPGLDSFTYTLTGGDTATVSLSIDGIDSNDTLVGTDGADTLFAGAGNDLIYALAGDDALYGGTGADGMFGGAGNDSYLVDNPGDMTTEAPGEGVDQVWSSIDHALSVNVENLTLIGAAILGSGNGLANVIVGNSAANSLYGGSGSDWLGGEAGADDLFGGAGADTMVGGTGNDAYMVDNVGDIVTEAVGEGTDQVWSSIGYTLAANIENLTLIGTGAISGTGNGMNNIIVGNGGANSLIGGGGNDWLSGGAGADSLYGGTGADTMVGGTGSDAYLVDNAGDAVVEASGEGTDQVWSSIDYALGANVENLTLTGAAAISGTGNGTDNVIVGNGGANSLIGGGGNDWLSGGGGADSLSGGTGNDHLSGGAGADGFYFDTALGGSNVDSIIDFSAADDSIYLDLSVFAGLSGAGALDAGAFRLGAAAADADDRIIYDQATGRLSYDSDGNGAASAVQFAQLAPSTALSEADFFAY